MLSTVTNALRVIEYLAEKNEAGISAISRYLNLAPSTAHRLVSTLASRDFIIQDIHSKKYRLGMKFFQLGSHVANRFGVRSAAFRNMEELAEKTGETVNLGVLVKEKIYYLEKISNDDPIRVELQVGRAVPAYCTGMGKAILAFLPSKKQKEILLRIRFEQRTKNTIADMDALRRELHQIRSKGIAVDNGELIEGISCIAAPVLSENSQAIAAISVAGPSFRITEEFIRAHTPHVIEAAHRTSREIQKLGVNVLTI
jgi:IclR family KDG regulon transcriptional repressor